MSEHTKPGFDTSVADLVEMVKQCTGHPDRQEPRIPSHFETIQQARKAAEALSEELAWATNTLRDREARIAQLESTVASLVAEVAEVKANANTALREACADAGKGGPCSREGCSTKSYAFTSIEAAAPAIMTRICSDVQHV